MLPAPDDTVPPTCTPHIQTDRRREAVPRGVSALGKYNITTRTVRSRQSKFDCFGLWTCFRHCVSVLNRLYSANSIHCAYHIRALESIRYTRNNFLVVEFGIRDTATTMADDKNGGGTAVVRTPNSDTCGMIVNHGADGWAAAAGAATLPPQAAAPADAAVFGVPIMQPAPPYGTLNNNNNNPVIKEQQQQLKPLKGPGNVEHRTKRPRRGKRKSKKVMPYMKDRMMVRYKAVAPNNTNQFLMEDHNDGPDIDKKISARYNNENGRTRNSSLTSLESDGEPIYSSSDEDGTSIQKEFIDTYRLVQEEQLAELSKNELTQRVIELEERVQLLESKRYKRNVMAYLNGTSKEDDEESIDPDPEEYKLMQLQIRELTTQNKLLQAEIETLKQVQTRTNNSDSSVDSESSSDSSDSSSSSSDGQDIEMKFYLRSTENDHAPKDN